MVDAARTGAAGIPTGVATGIGSMPGTDPAEAVAVVAGELALPHLPELPSRGVGADLIGRTAGLLAELPVDYVHRGYRLSSSATAETRRARDYLRWDLDALEEHWERAGLRASGPVKVQACGPYTFAANVELRGGHKVLRDHGAVRAVIESLAAGLADQLADVQRRLGAPVVVQLDEPGIDAVLDGTVPPLTRLDPIAPIPVAEVAQGLEQLAAALPAPVLLHNCAAARDTARSARRWELARLAPSYGLSVDLTLLTEREYDDLGALLDAGRVLAAGVVPSTDPGIEPARLVDDLAARLHALIDRIGLPRSVFAEQILITPTCGLAGASAAWARTAPAVATRIAEAVTAG